MTYFTFLVFNLYMLQLNRYGTTKRWIDSRRTRGKRIVIGTRTDYIRSTIFTGSSVTSITTATDTLISAARVTTNLATTPARNPAVTRCASPDGMANTKSIN